VWAWGWAHTDNPESVEIGRDIESFVEFISGVNSVCYFHNLRFDGWFIVDWLLKHDFYHSTTQGTIYPETFKTLISDMNKWYSLTVRWANGTTTEFRDSVKKLPMTIAKIAKSFGYEEGKGEIDYDKPRPVGYEPDANERDYIRRDVSILGKAIKQVHVDNKMKALTVASDSLKEYKELSGAHFERLFPVLSDAMDAEIRQAYRGGFTYASERFKGRKVGAGLVLDVNSLYPYIMRDRLLPHGEPVFYEGRQEPSDRYPLHIFSVTFTATLKPNHIPCIQIKGSMGFSPTEYLTSIDEPTTLMVTNVDWDLYNAHYDIDVLEYAGGWAFHAAMGMFDEYITKWSRIKEHSKHGIREIAKLHLNSLYGKFASNPNVTSKYPTLKDGVVKLVRGVDETRPPVYTPVGVFITSWARDLTIRAAQDNYDVFAYADTDSLHLLTTNIPESLEIDPHRLGAWKLEYHFQSAYYIRAKAYMELTTDGEYVNRIAGVPEDISGALTFDSLIPGMILHGKLTPKPVPGGVVLVDTPYELNLD